MNDFYVSHMQHLKHLSNPRHQEIVIYKHLKEQQMLPDFILAELFEEKLLLDSG